jgi:FkbM family methyltransferase
MASRSLSNIAERILHQLDVALRRHTRLGQLPGLRRILLKPYRKLIDFHGRGVLMNIGGCIPVRMPAEYAWKVVEGYEPESLRAMKKWLEATKSPVVVDVGCSFGFISCAGLFGNPASHVIAIDSDLESLKLAQRLCARAPQVSERLSLVWGFISDDPTQQADYLEAHKLALRALERPGLTGKPEAIHYVCLDSVDPASPPIPRHTLDNLIPPSAFLKLPILIKCDVEGAEQLVLNGAKRLLTERRPALLVSVHPENLPKYGTNKDALRSFLALHGYAIEVIAIDHEEHWWCVAT